MTTTAAILTDVHAGVESKQDAIIRAATEVFLRRGYGRTSMDAIARQAEVSKQTIYHHFGSKEALFGAIVDERCSELLTPPTGPDTTAADLETALALLGRQFLALVLAPSSLALHRLIVAEATRFPKLGRTAYESGPRVAVRRLARLLESHTRQGAITVEEPELAAEQFFGALIGHFQLRALLRVEDRPAVEQVDAAIKSAVRAFMAGHRRPRTIA